MSKNTQTAPLHAELHKRLASLVGEVGDVMAATDIGMSRFAIARAAAGLPVRPGTRSLIEQFFADSARTAGTSPAKASKVAA